MPKREVDLGSIVGPKGDPGDNNFNLLDTAKGKTILLDSKCAERPIHKLIVYGESTQRFGTGLNLFDLTLVDDNDIETGLTYDNDPYTILKLRYLNEHLLKLIGNNSNISLTFRFRSSNPYTNSNSYFGYKLKSDSSESRYNIGGYDTYKYHSKTISLTKSQIQDLEYLLCDLRSLNEPPTLYAQVNGITLSTVSTLVEYEPYFTNGDIIPSVNVKSDILPLESNKVILRNKISNVNLFNIYDPKVKFTLPESVSCYTKDNGYTTIIDYYDKEGKFNNSYRSNVYIDVTDLVKGKTIKIACDKYSSEADSGEKTLNTSYPVYFSATGLEDDEIMIIYYSSNSSNYIHVPIDTERAYLKIELEAYSSGVAYGKTSYRFVFEGLRITEKGSLESWSYPGVKNDNTLELNLGNHKLQGVSSKIRTKNQHPHIDSDYIQDYLTIFDNKIELIKNTVELIINNSSNIGEYAAGKGFYVECLPEIMNTNIGYCTHAPVIYTETNQTAPGVLIGKSDKRVYFINSLFYNASVSDHGLSAWKTWLSNNTVKILTTLSMPKKINLPDSLLTDFKDFKLMPNSVLTSNMNMELEYQLDPKLYFDEKFAQFNRSLAVTQANML